MLSADVKKVFILGAGSSIAHTNGQFPSIDKFFAKASELGLFKGDQYRELVEYAKETLGYSLTRQSDKTDIESFYTHLEIELERKYSIDLLAIRQQLLLLIQNVLVTLDSIHGEKEGSYSRFKENLHPNNSIITFNWDVLLDNILQRKEILSNRYGINKDNTFLNGQYWKFILKVTGFGENTMDGIGIGEPYLQWRPSKKGHFLKLHGSIDWRYCINEDCRAKKRIYPVLDIAESYRCSECHEQLEPLIIPPILNKQYKKYPAVRRIWNLAANEISNTDEIVIWGYRLPPTDFYSEWLIRQARKANVKKLVIINPSVVSSSRKKKGISYTFANRFYNLLKGSIDKKQIYLFEYFDDYLNHLDAREKYSANWK